VVLAVALFFAGITNIFRGFGIKLLAVTFSGTMLVFAATLVADLPVL
jgi:hypothetical protein